MADSPRRDQEQPARPDLDRPEDRPVHIKHKNQPGHEFGAGLQRDDGPRNQGPAQGGAGS